MMPFRSYAQRLLNPFRGVMNIIECQGAEAVTTDGRHWDIYVRDTGLVEDIADGHKVQTSDIRYGRWSLKSGLKRGAIYPSDDFKVLEHRGALVYEYLLKHHNDVPFPIEDGMELWLLAEDELPLGLLDSALRKEDIELDRAIDWRAGRECRKHFRSPPLHDLLEKGQTEISAGDYLTQHINEWAGKLPQAQWFRRRSDGSGIGLSGINLETGLEGRRLPNAAFPTYFLREDACSAPHRQLIQDYLAWQAPHLLLLQNLDAAARRRFERLATSRALSVDQQYRLYPLIVDEAAINTARVEAALRRNEAKEDEEEKAMATYYIELNVTRTN
jgi:hypothetical protein